MWIASDLPLYDFGSLIWQLNPHLILPRSFMWYDRIVNVWVMITITDYVYSIASDIWFWFSFCNAREANCVIGLHLPSVEAIDEKMLLWMWSCVFAVFMKIYVESRDQWKTPIFSWEKSIFHPSRKIGMAVRYSSNTCNVYSFALSS